MKSLLPDAVAKAYAKADRTSMDNRTLFEMLADKQVVGPDELERKSPVGQAGRLHSVVQRQLCWHQQTLKHLELLVGIADHQNLVCAASGWPAQSARRPSRRHCPGRLAELARPARLQGTKIHQDLARAAGTVLAIKSPFQ